MKNALVVATAMFSNVIGCASSAPPPSKSAATAPAATAPVESVPPFQTNVVADAQKNDAYRRVLFTGARSQLVAMTIPVGGDIGLESHPRVEQLIFIEDGNGKAILNGVETPVSVGDVVVATPGAEHDIVNTGAAPLHIYTVYTPPNHIDGRIHESKQDAEHDKADEAFGRRVE